MERDLPRKNLSFIDVYSRLDAKTDLFQTLKGKPDRIHPNAQGDVKIAHAWAEAVLKTIAVPASR